MTLNDIIQSAQGGQGVQSLAARFGLSPQEMQSALQAILPALSLGLQRAAQDPAALVGEIASGDHALAYADPAQAGAGSGALGAIFGGPNASARVADQIAQASGLDPALVAQLLPALASMALGGLAHALQTEGHGEILTPAPEGGGLIGSLVSAVEGALGPERQAGIERLIHMFQPGVAPPPGHVQALEGLLPK